MRPLACALICAISSAAALAAGPDSRVADAAKNGDAGAVISLLKQHANVNTPQADGTTAIAWAARRNDLDLAGRLIRAGADVKAANRYGVTPLYLACVNGSAAMIGKLLDAGADANAAVTEGETALMTAARSGSVEATKVLLAHGADVNAKESWHGETALMWAVSERHPEMAAELIAHGADVNARSTVNQWERQVTAEPREKWLPLGGLTPLLFAARQGCLDCAKILLDKGANINDTDPNGISPTLIAIINGHYDVAGFLLDKGADPNLADSTGRTALYAAVDFHTMPADNRPPPNELAEKLTSMDVIQSLIAHGANVNVQLKKQAPYRAKLDRGDDTMFNAGTTPLLRAAKAGDTEVVKLLLAKGADPSLSTRQGINPLMAAAGVGTKEEDTTGRNKTEAEAIATIQMLMSSGLDLNAADGRGDTALHGAAQQGMDQVIQFLADHGAKLDAKNRRGLTPLDAAMGKAGGFGFAGQSGIYRKSTVALLQRLMAGPTAKNEAQPQ